MSGWIKVEKELETDPRTLRMAKAIAKRWKIVPITESNGVEMQCNAVALPAVTVVCGALTRLWMFADSHIRSDNTLDMSAAEIDEWLGIPGFCDLLPTDWLVPLDDKSVELPGFLAHNGVEAKKKALGSKRVENHRIRTAAADCNADALPDQTRLDQTRPDQSDGGTAPQSASDVSRESNSDAEWFLDFKLVYPDRAGDKTWRAAQKAANARIAEGHNQNEFLRGASAYAKFCQATGKVGTEFVMQAARFLGPSKPFMEPWKLPATKADNRLASNLDVMQQFVAGGA